MEVKIYGHIYEYESDFPAGWEFSKGDPFKFPVTIGPASCFIKRFEKHPADISGWPLLQRLAEEDPRKPATLTRVHDTVSIIENNKIVHYVFFEYLHGQTLHIRVIERGETDLFQLTDDLFAAIQTLQNYGCWFPDFCEKNIFRNEHGRFLLIDLDSTHPMTDLPDNDMWGCKDYWILVIRFCKEFMNYNDALPEHFNGASFNYLHAIFLILRLKIYYGDNSTEYESLFDELPGYLNAISPSFKDVFRTVYERREMSLKLQKIAEIKNLVITEILSPSAGQIKNKSGGNAHPGRLPVINRFEINKFVEKKGDRYVVNSGEVFELQWEVDNASELQLYKNEVLYLNLGFRQQHLELTEELYDRDSKAVKYTLMASNGDVQTKSSLEIEVVFKRAEEADSDLPFFIKIHHFSVKDFLEKKDNQYTVKSGQYFTLQWDVENAQKIVLYRNGVLYKQLRSDETNTQVKDTVAEDKQALIEYKLIISNSNYRSELVEEAPLTVKVINQPEKVTIPQSVPVHQYPEKPDIQELPTPPNPNKKLIIALSIILGLVLLIILFKNFTKDAGGNSLPVDSTTILRDSQAFDSTNSINTTVLHSYAYYDSLGNVYAGMGTYDEAIKCFDSAIKMNGNYAEAYYNRGKMKYYLKNYTQAVEDFTKAIQLDPNDANAYYLRGRSQFKSGQKNGACNDFQKSCNLGNDNGCKAIDQLCKTGADADQYTTGPVNATAEAIKHNNKGIAKVRSGDYKGAIEDFTSAIQLDRTYTGVYYQRGMARYYVKDYNGAIEDYTKVIQLNPNFPGVYYRRGLAAFIAGNKDAACNDFQKGCSLGDKNACGQYTQFCN